MSGMTNSEYARHRGCSPAAVTQALAARKIRKERDGKIDPVKADQAWAVRSNPINGNHGAKPAAPAHQEPTWPIPRPVRDRAQEVANLGPVEKLDLKIKMAHLREKDADADVAERKRDLLCGSLMQVADVKSEVATMMQQIRDHVLAQADRLCHPLAAVESPAAVHQILSRDNRAMLQKLSKAVAAAGLAG
jgi:hypothetical protein